jgi:hypothetical protein
MNTIVNTNIVIVFLIIKSSEEPDVSSISDFVWSVIHNKKMGITPHFLKLFVFRVVPTTPHTFQVHQKTTDVFYLYTYLSYPHNQLLNNVI